jgi:hypothetical protein
MEDFGKITSDIDTLISQRQTPGERLTDTELDTAIEFFGDDDMSLLFMERYTEGYKGDRRTPYVQLVNELNSIIREEVQGVDDMVFEEKGEETPELRTTEYQNFVIALYQLALSLDDGRPYEELTKDEREKDNGFSDEKIEELENIVRTLYDDDTEDLIAQFLADETRGMSSVQITDPDARIEIDKNNKLNRTKAMLIAVNNVVFDKIESEEGVTSTESDIESDDSIGGSLSFKKYKNVNDLLKAFDKQEKQLKGGAIGDDAKRYLDKGITFAKWANRVWTGAQKYPNERHYPMYVDGKVKMANYMGSGTSLMKRLRDGDQPISYVDKVSQLHDMMYQKSALSNTREEMRAKKRQADEEMINLLNLAKEFRLDNRVNIGIAMLGIKGKMKIENVLPSFITDKLGDEFTGDLEKLPENDVIFLNNEKERVVNELYNKVEEQKQRFQQNQPQEDIQGGRLNKHMEMFRDRQRGYGLYFR